MAARKNRPWGRIKPTSGSSINWGDPISQGLLACYLFNEDGGNIANDIVRNNNGSLVGGAARSVGQFGSLLDFDGTNDYVDCGSVLTLGTDYTVCAWVNVDTTTGGQTIVSYRDTASSTPVVFLIDFTGSTSVRFFVRNGAAASLSATTSGGLIVGQFVFVALVRTGDTIKGYVNNTSATAGGAGINAITANSFNIGATVAGTSSRLNFLNGKIDNVRIYNRALILSEIKRLYTMPYSGIVMPNLRIRSTVAGAPPPSSGFVYLGGFF